MKKAYFPLTIIALVIMAVSGNAQCVGNHTPSVTPSITSCGGTINGVTDQTISFDLLIQDADNDVITLSTGNFNPLPPSAVVTPSLPFTGQTPYTVTVAWTPTASDYQIYHHVTFIVTDPCTGTSCDLTLHSTCTNPTISCPAPPPFQANAPGIGCRASVFSYGTPSVTGYPAPVVTYNPPEGSIFNVGTTMVIATATNDCGSESCTFPVTVIPANKPTVICPPDTIVPAATCTNALVYFNAPHAYSNIDIREIETFPYSAGGGLFPIGTTTVTVTARDECGTVSDPCSFTVTVNPPLPPFVYCPGDRTADATICTGALVSFQLSGVSLYGDAYLHSQPASGDVFHVGSTTVIVTASDDCLNTSTCSFNVTVNPPGPPDVTCPPDIIAAATSCAGATVNYSINAFSTYGIDHIDYGGKGPGSVFPVGTTTVTIGAFDNCGHSSSCSFNVTVTPYMTVSAGADASTIFGYATTQTVTRTALITGGIAPYSYSWSLSRPLKCNQVNNTGDELFTGGTCTNNICPGAGASTASAPACSGNSTISATLLADADACVTVTDASGCIVSDCFHIAALDGRCFTGNAGKNKAKICHLTGSQNNPSVTICVAKSVANNFLANHPGDYLGPCHARTGYTEEEVEAGLTFYPNPFTSTGTILFTAAEDAHAVLEVFSSLGAKITTVFDGDVYADEPREFSFDGSSLTPGIYLCKLTVGTEVYYTRMVLTR